MTRSNRVFRNIGRVAVLVASLQAGLLSACSSDDGSPTSPPTPPVAETPSPQPPGGPGGDGPRTPEGPREARGALVSSELLATMSKEQVKAIIDQLGASEIVAPRYGVAFHRVVYWTPDLDGRLSQASSLVIVPEGKGSFPVLSDQHGTQVRRRAKLSDPLLESEAGFVGLLFASEGWVISAADYLGLGVSPGVHPYYHVATEASATVDALRATQELLTRMGMSTNGELFLAGYSQGAHVTMALHRALDQEPIPGLRVVASAPMAGAYALADLNVPAALTSPAPTSAFYLAYLMVAYDRVYGIYDDPAQVFRAPWASQVESLFDGTRDIEEIVAALPKTPAELLQPAYYRALLDDPNHPLLALLRANEAIAPDWKPSGRIRLFHGGADVDVPFASSERALALLRDRGASVSLVNLGPDVDHAAGGLPAYLGAKVWFDRVRAGLE